MTKLKRAAIILALIEEMKKKGSWCGETHLQKAVYFLQNIFNVPLDYHFILYKHGPFSYELRDELTAFRADAIILLQFHQYPYGPSLIPTGFGYKLMGKFPKTIESYKKEINSVSTIFGSKGVSDLEKLATALFITKEDPELKRIEKRCKKIKELKPHITKNDAKEALKFIDKIILSLKNP